MSIRALAMELYKAQQKANQLQKTYEEAALKDRDGLLKQLKIAQKDVEVLRKMLDGRKESGDLRKRYPGIGGN